MARDLSAAMATQVAAAAKRPVYLVEIGFASTTAYIHSRSGDLDWNGNTYQGVGQLGGFTPVRETAEVRAEGIRLYLNGIPSEQLSNALTDAAHGQTVSLRLGFVDDSDQLVADPAIVFQGRVDTFDIEEGADSGRVEVVAENRLIDLERSRERRYTDEDQHLDDATDTGFSMVPQLPDLQVQWGGRADV